MTFTAIIIDDEEFGRNALKSSLKMFCQSFEIIGEADSVGSGLNLLKSCNPDVLFLDIRMKDGTGFDLLQLIEDHDFNLVFTTAYDEYAIKAFKFSAIDYLLKPIDPESLIELEKKLAKSTNSHLAKKKEILLGNKESLQLIGLHTFEGLSYFRIEELVRCEANSNYTSFHFLDKKVLVSRPLKDYEEILPVQTFFRIHKSHLIQQKFIKRINKSSSTVEMYDGTILELARRRKDLFIDWMSHG